MAKNKISLERIRPERSETRRLVTGKKTKQKSVSFELSALARLEAAAAAKGLSLSLYINLILTGQEKSPI